MKPLADIPGLIVVLNEATTPSLADFAMRRGWTIIKVSSAMGALAAILRRRPRLLVVQVSAFVNQTAELIRQARARLRPLPIVAVARSHDETVERTIRGAGASCYLPIACDADPLDATVTSLLAERTPSNGVEADTDEMSPVRWSASDAYLRRRVLADRYEVVRACARIRARFSACDRAQDFPPPPPSNTGTSRSARNRADGDAPVDHDVPRMEMRHWR